MQIAAKTDRRKKIQKWIAYSLAAVSVSLLAYSSYLFTVLSFYPGQRSPSITVFEAWENIHKNYSLLFNHIFPLGTILGVVSVCITPTVSRLIHKNTIHKSIGGSSNISRNSSFDPRLSGLRGLAAFGVVLLHEFFLHLTGIWVVYNFPNNLFFVPFTNTLYIGVPIFLMLSIYLLLGRLRANSNLKNYFKRRIIRIWPIYFGVVSLVILLPASVTTSSLLQKTSLFTFSTYYLNLAYPFPTGPFWTLQVEELVYVLLPLIAILSIENKTRLGLTLVGIGLVYYLSSPFLPVIPFVHLSLAEGGFQLAADYMQINLLAILPAYGFGLLVYTRRIFPQARWLILVGLAGLTSLPFTPLNETQFYLQASFYFLTLFGAAGVLSNPPEFLKWFTILGEESYGLYAVHWFFIVLFGLFGIPMALISAFLIEFALRPKQVKERLRLAYPFLTRRPLAQSNPENQ